MEIDQGRWQKLLADITALAAQNSGYNLQLADLERRRDNMARELMAIEQTAKAPIPRRSRDPLAAVAAEAHEAQIQSARDELARFDDELRRTNQQADAAFARLSRLRRLETACRTWAQQAGVTLPGEASGTARAIVQPSAPGRPFITQGATA